MPDVPICGNADKDVSDVLKAMIKGQNAAVVGLIGEGTSLEVVANWNSPFEGDSLGSLFSKPAGLLQIQTGRTSLTALASHQIWEGNQPHLFNLVLKFYALADAYQEVEAPIRELEKMMAPDVNRITPGGRIPQHVMINVGRKRLYPECVITSMSVPLDKERDKNGNLIRCAVSLQVETIEMITKKFFG